MVSDRYGQEVKVGSWVKVIYIDPNYIESLPDDDAIEIESMLDQVLKVTEIIHGKALVKLSVQLNKFKSMSLALSSEEMELIKPTIENVSLSNKR